jgi:hypothetical protein
LFNVHQHQNNINVMASLQEIGLAALIFNERWQEVRRELQWNPEIFRSFRLRDSGGGGEGKETGGEPETVFHLLCSKGDKCPLDILESVLNIAPDLVKINSEALLQSLILNQMWEIVLIVLKFYPDIIRTSLFVTRQGHLITTLHLLCIRHAGVVCPPMNVVDGVVEAAPEALQWKGPGIPLHYAIHAYCIEPLATERRKRIDLLNKLLQQYPEGVAVSTLAPEPPMAGSPIGCCTPLQLAVTLGALPLIVQNLLRSCPKHLLHKAGVHESYQNILRDPTLYATRDDDRKEILDCLRPPHYLPTVAAVCTVPIIVAAIIQPRYLRTSLGAMAVFNLTGGSKWCLDVLERRRLRPPGNNPVVPAVNRILVPELVKIASPGLALKFHDGDKQAAQSLLPATQENAADQSTADACVVCWEETADHVLIPCGHVCLCVSCSKHLRNTLRNKCPVCNGIVQQALKIFGAGIATKS